MGRIERGTDKYRRVNLALFCAGFITFLTLYDVQPLLPVFTREFGIAAALGSLPLSISTGAMAVAMLLAGTVSDTFGRKRVMAVSLFVTSVLALLTAFTHTFSALLAVRLLEGAAMGGVPAVAMAYLSEEMDPASLAPAMGLYIAGNAVGGMSGRIFTATVSDFFPWRIAIGSIGLLCLLLSLYFAKALPASAHAARRPFAAPYFFSSLLRHLGDRRLVTIYTIIFLAMGSFVTLFNYITFRLLASPYHLTQTRISLIFLVYLLGSCSSTYAGRLVRRLGRGTVLGLSLATMILATGITLLSPLSCIVAGIALFTSGFFGTHAVASTWVGQRAETAKAQAAALYLCFYYLGSSLSGTAGGFFWAAGGWEGVAGLIAVLLSLALFLALRLGFADRRKAAVAAPLSFPAPEAASVLPE